MSTVEKKGRALQAELQGRYEVDGVGSDASSRHEHAAR